MTTQLSQMINYFAERCSIEKIVASSHNRSLGSRRQPLLPGLDPGLRQALEERRSTERLCPGGHIVWTVCPKTLDECLLARQGSPRMPDG